MRALFHLNGSEEVEVEPCPSGKGVFVRVINCAPDVNRPEGVRHVERELSLLKSEARAIASAMMGCAAEV
jgi:hypothetical protein